jgi:methyl-accepting chemotaxis protein
MKNIQIGPRLIGSYVLIAALAFGVGLYLMREMNKISDAGAEMYERAVLPLGSLVEQASNTTMIRLSTREIAMLDDIEGEKAQRDSILRVFDAGIKNVIESVGEQRSISRKKENQQRLDNFAKVALQYQREVHGWAERINRGDESVLEPPELKRSIVIPSSITNYGNEIMHVSEAIAAARRETGVEINESNALLNKSAKSSGVAALLVLLVISICFGVYMTLSITRPLKTMVKVVDKGSEGDLSVRSGLAQNDELGRMAKDLDVFFEHLSDIMRDLKMKSETLAGASEELSSISRQLKSGAEESAAQSSTIASATEEMSVNISAMAGAATDGSSNANEAACTAEQMSVNMNTIAAAIEEMSSSIGQIANNAMDARQIASQATEKAHDATEAMNKLGLAAKEIGKVTDVIKKIADKTNLLALNATIEAASAGDAGKGFAVVAGEIKDLANQSAKSADDIAHRIESIQLGTGDAITVIQDVSDIIVKINQSVGAIAGHVDQQTKASNEIASNVAQANVGAKRVASAIGGVAKTADAASRNASEMTKGANNVSSNVSNMNQIARENAQGAEQVNQSAADLSKIAGDLKVTVNKFKV